MGNFEFFVQTKIIFGQNSEEKLGETILSFNYKKALVLFGGKSARKTGLFDKILSNLNENNIEYLVLEGIRPNPEFSFVLEHLDQIKAFRPDIIIAVGGGSVIDTAKSIAVSYFYDGYGFDFNLHKANPTKALPIGVVLTISAAGSEMSTSCVMQDDETNIKSGFNSNLVRPLFAIENPELTFTVNKEQTAYGIVDILMHTLERFFSESTNYQLADDLSIGLIKSVIKSGEVAFANPNDYDARSNLMLSSSLSHNGLTSVCKAYKMPVHALEHALSGLYPAIAHGAGLAVLFPRWARYYINYDPEKFDYFAKEVFNLSNNDIIKNGLEGIEKLEEYFSSLDLPKNFRELGVDNPNIDKLVEIVTCKGTRVVGHHKKPMDEEVVREIFTNCI